MQFFSSARRYVCDLAGLPQPGARVDPALFPEADYPVYCMRCGYELRGLTEPRCPECGEAFERGQLLVDQYLRRRRPRSDPRYRLARRIDWLAGAFIAVALAAAFCLVMLPMLWPDAVFRYVTAGSVPLFWVFAIPVGAALLASFCTMLSLVLKLSRVPPLEKRRAVMAAWKAGRREAQK